MRFHIKLYDMKRSKILLISVFLFAANIIFSQSRVENYLYAKKDTSNLRMDVYFPEKKIQKNTCIIYMFGGGFAIGSKSISDNVSFCKSLSDSGFVVVAIDYRLGMKNVHAAGLKGYFALKKSIRMAEEDLLSATEFLLANTDKFGIDDRKIIVCGSSAGAVSALQTDYDLCNAYISSGSLPTDFRFAGVISFAGGILSQHGNLHYAEKPAPVLLFHGIDDTVVSYNGQQKLNVGFFGSNSIAEHFKQNQYPYNIYRFRNCGHEIALFPKIYYQKEIVSFIRHISENSQIPINDVIVENCNYPKPAWSNTKLRDLYKKKH